MPFVRTQVHRDLEQPQRAAIVQGIHQALVDAIGMPEDELFNMVSGYAPEDFFFSRSFNGYARSERPVVIDITLRRGRSDAMKRELYRRVAEQLQQRAQIDPSDVFIFMHENDYSDWSVGGGRFAMAIAQQRGDVAP